MQLALLEQRRSNLPFVIGRVELQHCSMCADSCRHLGIVAMNR